jgi:hypothetical protein
MKGTLKETSRCLIEILMSYLRAEAEENNQNFSHSSRCYILVAYRERSEYKSSAIVIYQHLLPIGKDVLWSFLLHGRWEEIQAAAVTDMFIVLPQQ